MRSGATCSAGSCTARGSRSSWGLLPCRGHAPRHRLGLASGYCEGRVDSVLQRGVDTVMAVPGIVLALAVMSVLGQSLST